MKLNLIVIILDGKAVTRMQEKRILVTDLSNGVFPVSFTSNKVLQEDSKIQCFQKVQHMTNLKALSKGLLET